MQALFVHFCEFHEVPKSWKQVYSKYGTLKIVRIARHKRGKGNRVFFSPFGPKLKRQKTQEITITQGFFPKTQQFFPQNSNFRQILREKGWIPTKNRQFWSKLNRNSRIFFRNSSFFSQNSIFRQVHLTYLPMNGWKKTSALTASTESALILAYFSIWWVLGILVFSPYKKACMCSLRVVIDYNIHLPRWGGTRPRHPMGVNRRFVSTIRRRGSRLWNRQLGDLWRDEVTASAKHYLLLLFSL